jgi:hypothetical protein
MYHRILHSSDIAALNTPIVLPVAKRCVTLDIRTHDATLKVHPSQNDLVLE